MSVCVCTYNDLLNTLYLRLHIVIVHYITALLLNVRHISALIFNVYIDTHTYIYLVYITMRTGVRTCTQAVYHIMACLFGSFREKPMVYAAYSMHSIDGRKKRNRREHNFF